MTPEITHEQLSLVLDELVFEQLTLAGIDRPPVDAFALADALQLTVARDVRLEHRARLVRLNYSAGRSRTSILIAPDPRPERRQWSVAHELGEHLANEACLRLGIRAVELPDNGRERLANLLANRILLPGEWFFPDARRAEWDLFALKKRFATASHELIARRMLDGAPRIIVSVYDHDRLTWRRGNANGRIRPPSSDEIDCRRAAHVTGETAVDEYVVAWAIHEPGWKREIVRVEVTEIDGDWD